MFPFPFSTASSVFFSPFILVILFLCYLSSLVIMNTQRERLEKETFLMEYRRKMCVEIFKFNSAAFIMKH